MTHQLAQIVKLCQNIDTMLAQPNQFTDLITAFQNGTKLEFSKGEFIIRPGDTPPGVFFIESGLVKAYDITKYGEENLLIVRKENEVFPLIWAITGQERHVIYQALVPTVVRRMSRSSFLNHIHSQPESLNLLLDMTIEMYRIHSERILNLEYRTVRERLISFLLTMGQRFGQDTEDGLLINVPLRHQDIASSISATRESTGKELAILEKQGLIKNKALLITLFNQDKLKSFLR